MAVVAYGCGVALVVATLAKLDARLNARLPTVVAAPTAANQALLAQLPALAELYEPFPLLRNRHLASPPASSPGDRSPPVPPALPTAAARGSR